MMRPQQRRNSCPQPDPELQHQGIRSDQYMGICRYAEAGYADTDNDHKAELIHVHMLGNAAR